MPSKKPYIQPPHSTKIVELGHYGLVEIDDEIVDLIKGLYDLGWYTEMSCQDNTEKHRVWLLFGSPFHAECFMNFIALESKTIRPCIRSAATEGYDRLPKKVKWAWKNRWWVDACTRTPRWPRVDTSIEISIRFPREHLAEVTRIIKREIKKRKKEDAEGKTGRPYISK